MAPTMSTTAALVVCFLCFAPQTFSKPLSQNVELSSSDRLYYFGQKEVQDFELVSPHVTHREGNTECKMVSFDAFGEGFRLVLLPVEGLIDAGTLVHEVGKHGKTVLGQPTDFCLYQGTSETHEDSAVTASDCGNKFEATIATKDAAFHIQPLKAKHKDKDGPTHMVVRRSINTGACSMKAERPFEATSARRKRSTRDPIYVEASVVADDLMYKTYRNNTKNYLLTILNQVAGLFKDSSLDVQVNLKISNIKIVKAPQRDLVLSEELDESLASFCSWQKESNSDISILITRRNLISGGSHEVTGKTADVAGACDPERRCLIGQDHGPSGLIFTLAHEIGHALGMYHDGGLSDCANRQNIMASVNSGGPEAFRWSKCSNNDLLNFLDLPESKCLKDKPKSLPSYTPSSIPMPGFYYNASEQCAMTFGGNSVLASKVLNKPEICEALVCKTGKGAPQSTNTPPLDGTRCGTKRDICIHGECLKVYSTLDCDGGECIPFWLASGFICNVETCMETRSVLCVEQHDDGTTRRVTDLSRCPAEVPVATRTCQDDPCRYTFFEGEFGACSVTCGIGTQTRVVFCQDGTDGQAVADELCTLSPKPETTQACNTGVVCSEYSYATGEFQACSVTCGSGVQTRSVACQNSQNVVVAETFCINLNLDRPEAVQDCDTGVVCPNTLRYIGGPLGQCSVTCGTGVRERQIYCVNGLNRIVDNSNCEAANLVPPSTQTVCTLEACPVTIYTAIRGQFGQCSVTCGTGVETRVVICLDGNSEQVAMQNCIDFGLTDLETQRACQLADCPPEFRFEAGEYTDCSVTCGSGVRTRTVQCLDQQNQVADISNCLQLGLTPPPSSIICTLPECATYLYQTTEFGQCSEECGDGQQFRTVVCVNNDTNEIVADENCSEEKPASTQPCNLGDCNTVLQFVSGPFVGCNCSGIQTRLVICILRTGNILERVPSQQCLDDGLELPASSQTCTPPPECVQPNPVWQATEWGECSVTCGLGTQNRLVYCIQAPGSNAIVNDSLCVPGDRPPSTRPCDTGVTCPTAYVWLAYEWGPCSVTCGGGFEMRDVFCFSLGDNVIQVNDSLCNAGERPPSVRPCSLDPCTASWTTTDWSECSVTCGPGVETRSIACRVTKDPTSNLVDETECIAEDRPSDTRPCYVAICPSPFGCDTTSILEGTIQYVESSPGFNEGSNYPNDLDCDKGFAAEILNEGDNRVRRNVETTPEYCIQLTFTAFDLEDSTNCEFDFLEITDVRYNTSERLCGNSYELPLVWKSLGPHIEMYFHTDATINRPGYSVIYNAVEKEEPARYVSGEWSECSVTCGEGVQTREVTCYRGNETVDELECSELQRPASTQPCELDPCVEPSSCSGDLLRTEDNGIILSPNFPSSYPNNVSCFNNIQAPLGMVVQITATYLNLRASEECEDRLVIRDLNSDGDGLVLCGPQSPGVIFTSVTNEVVIQFITNRTGVILPNGFGYSLQVNFINEQGTPCGREITTSGQAVYSPNYPENYTEGENCLTVIRNDDGCIQVTFLDFDLAPPGGNGECSDFVQLVDLTQVNVATQRLCGSELPYVFYSATGLLTVRFLSDDTGPAYGGYNAVTRFVECYDGVWFVGPYEPCSATCGESFRVRTVICQDPATLAAISPDRCPPEVPESAIKCDVEECPSCNVDITVSGQTLLSPNSPQAYENNQRCVTDITNSEGCVAIQFLAFDLEPGLTPGLCDKDYLEIVDAGRSMPIRYCGNMIPPNYISLSGNVQLIFQSDETVVSTGYVAYETFVPCPVNAYVTGNWSECSVTCGVGMRTRDVECMDLLNNIPAADILCSGMRPPSEEACDTRVECPSCDVYVNETGQFLTSPDFPSPYAPNQRCTYTFESPNPSLCVRLTFLEAYLNGPAENGLCSNDYIEVSSNTPQPETRYCPESARSITWYSRNNQATLDFVTDEEGSGMGFNLYSIFGQCPRYDYTVGEFSECSARCGGGTMTRTVTCQPLNTNQIVAPELCPNQEPLATVPCNEEPCPVCDESFLPGDELVTSPGFSDMPPAYETMLDCTYNITNPEGCLFLTFLDFNLQECTDCECDSLTIIENGDEALPPLCGVNPLRTYPSQTGNVALKFKTDGSVSAPGFNIHVAYVECPDTFFFTGEYSECDVSCGGGMQTREVYCQSRATSNQVPDAMCAGLKPPATRSCGEDPCPFCDEDVTTPSFITSPDYPDNYPLSINCNYNITAPVGECVTILFLQLEVGEPAVEPEGCEGDFVEITDESAPTLDRRYCGSIGPNTIEWTSRSSNVNLRFYSDAEDTYQGFRGYVNFNSCPVYGFQAGEFGMCSSPCGGGTQERQVNCVHLIQGFVTTDNFCEDERPADSQPCNTEPCPVCDEVITTERQNIFSLNFPEPYFEYSCNYLYSNPGGCIELLFVQFELPVANGGNVCDRDYLLVEDNSERPFSHRICGRDLPSSITSRGDTLNVTLITDGNPATFGQGYQLYNLFTDSRGCPQSGYVAGEWGECDRQCGGGVRTREVNCIDLASGVVIDDNLCSDIRPRSSEFCNNEPCPPCDQQIDTFPTGLQSPNYPAAFDPQRRCVFTVTTSRCVRITFLSFDLPPPLPLPLMCGDSYLELDDLGAAYLMQRFCGDGPERQPGDISLYSWESRTGQVEITLNSGSDIPDGSGFSFYLTEVDCPEYGFIAGNFSECSTTCGNDGVETRSVECRRLATLEIAASEDLCTDPKPRETRPCAPQDPCPSCDLEVDTANTLIMGPPRDGTWTTNVNCEYTITLEGSCVGIAALDLTLSDPDVNDTCVNSSLTITDGTYPAYSQQICGSPSPLPVNYRSLSNQFIVDFYSADYLASPDSFGLFVLSLPCPTEFLYRSTQFSECSVSCGGGVRTREVYCERTDTSEEVPDELCPDNRPPSMEACNTAECPQECNNVISSNSPVTVLTSPGSPTYVTDADCLNNIVALSGCVVLTVLSMDIEEGTVPGVCDTDYLEISDASFSDLTVRLCGNTPPSASWRSMSGVVRTRFVSDGNDTQQAGYSLAYSFTPTCPTGSYVLDNFNACSVTCGGGIRTAGTVQCVLPDTSIGTNDDCPGLPPSPVEECNTDPCPEFYFYTGLFSPCTSTCTGGTQTRTVECRRVDNDTVVDDLLCPGVKPPTIEACNALIPCSTSDIVVTSPATTYNVALGNSGTIQSPNYPMNYPDSLSGQVVFMIPSGTVLMVVIETLDLAFKTPCSNGDFMLLQSGVSSLSICNMMSLPFTWFSSTSSQTVTISFTANPPNSAMGFSGTWSVISP